MLSPDAGLIGCGAIIVEHGFPLAQIFEMDDGEFEYLFQYRVRKDRVHQAFDLIASESMPKISVQTFNEDRSSLYNITIHIKMKL